MAFSGWHASAKQLQTHRYRGEDASCIERPLDICLTSVAKYTSRGEPLGGSSWQSTHYDKTYLAVSCTQICFVVKF